MTLNSEGNSGIRLSMPTANNNNDNSLPYTSIIQWAVSFETIIAKYSKYLRYISPKAYQ